MALMQQELKYKKSKISFTFNAPAEPKTKYSTRANIGGLDNQKVATTLIDRYGDTLNLEKMQKN